MKRIISFFLAAVLLAALLLALPLTAFAAKAKSTISYETLDIIDPKLWSAENASVAITESDDVTSLTFVADSNAKSISFKAEFGAKDLSNFTELVLDIAATSEKDVLEYTVVLGTKVAENTYTHTLSSSRDRLYIPLTSDVFAALSSISVTADSKDGTISDVTLYSVTADSGYSYAFLKNFSSVNITSENKLKANENSVTVYPENGTCDLTFTFADTYTQKRDVLAWISFKGADTGSIRATASDAEGNITETASQSINQSGKYSFLTKGGFETLTVHFADLPSAATVITVFEAGIFDMGGARESVGNLTSCRWDGKKVVLSGSISNEASVKYNGAKLLLYAIPVTDAYETDLSRYSPALVSNFSTKFKISFVPDKSHCEYFYKVVLDTKDGLLSIGDTVSPSSGTLTPAASSAVSAIHGADAADIFETNASSVILDVKAGELIEGENTYSAQLYSYSGKTYYFNKATLSTLDDSMRFFTAAGINVYLRLFSDSDGFAFDYSADDENSLTLMCAVASFLAERYVDAKGFIMGIPINEHTWELSPNIMCSKARLISAFTEAIKMKKPDAAVVVPYTNSETADPFLACSMINYYLSVYKSGAVVSMYETKEDELLSTICASRLSSIASLFSASSDGTAIFWKAPSSYTDEELTAVYRTLCVSGTAAGIRFTALSVSDTQKSPALYDSLKAMLDNENVILSNTNLYTASVLDKNFKGSYGLWDFTSSYDTGGWVSGGSFSAPFTAKGEKGERVLKAQNTGTSNGSGILICKTQPALDLSGISAKVTLAVTSETAKNADIAVIFSSGDSRAEFSATIDCNKKTSLICDMKDFAGAAKIDFAAVIVRGGVDADAQISKIELCSDTLDSQALETRFSTNNDPIHHPVLYAVTIFIAAATVAIFSILLKKQKRKGKTV